jgi:hypothetical protein
MALLQAPPDLVAGEFVDPIQIAARDQFENLATSYNGPVTFSLTISGTLVLLSTFQNGLAVVGGDSQTFAVTQSGSYHYSLTAPGLPTLDSETFGVSPAAATHLALSANVQDTAAGQPFSAIVIEARDTYENIVETFASNITLSLTNAQSASLFGTTTLPFQNGVASFDNLSMTMAGDYSLNIVGDSLPSIQSNSFTVSPSVPDHLTLLQQPANGMAAFTLAPVLVAVKDQFENTVTSDTSSISLSLASGTATLRGNTSVPAVNGIATFNNFSVSRAGAFTLAIEDGLLPLLTSDSFTITPNIPNRLICTQKPPTGAAGSLGSILIMVADINGNPVETDTSIVSLSITSGSKSITGTISTPVVEGFASFDGLAIPKSGTYSINAQDGSLTPATSSFTLGAKLAFRAKFSPTAAGDVISSFQVLVKDSKNKLLTSDDSPITLSIASGNGALLGTLTASAVNGIATFSGLSIQASGIHKFRASSGSITAATSSGLSITPGPLASLAIFQDASNATAGAKLPALKLQLLDSFGNLATNSRQKITLSLLSGPTGALLSGSLIASPKKGIVTFSKAILKTMGDYTLQAAGGPSIAFSPFTVNPAAAKILAFSQQPSPGTVGAPLDPAVVVDLFDSFGNLVTDATVDITLKITSAPAGALRPLFTATASSGHATFTTLQLDTAGGYRLQASARGLKSVTSDLFTITPP